MKRHIVIVRDGFDEVQVKAVARVARKWVHVAAIPEDPEAAIAPNRGTGFPRDRLFEYDPDVHARLLIHEAAGRDPWEMERDKLQPFIDADEANQDKIKTGRTTKGPRSNK